MRKVLVCVVVAALAGGTLIQTARADTAEATCELRKDGEKQKGKSGPCTFGQRQGYIDIDLKNGDKISLSPVGSGPGKYKDQNGTKVTRTSATAKGMDFKWEGGKHLTVTYVASGSGGGSVGAAATKSGEPSKQEQACLAAVSRKANNGEVAVLSSEFSQANTLVMIGVGAQRAPWRCLVSNSGVVQEVMFAGSEGRL